MERKETISIPVYSNIKMVNGRIIALVEDVIEMPETILKEDDSDDY